MLTGAGQSRLEIPRDRSQSSHSVPAEQTPPAVIAGVPNTGDCGCRCSKPLLEWVPQSRAKIHGNVMSSQAQREAEAVVGDTHALAVLFPAQHQHSLVTLGTFCFCPSVGWGQWDAPSLTKLFAKGSSSLSQLEVTPLRVRIRNPDVSCCPIQTERRRHSQTPAATLGAESCLQLILFSTLGPSSHHLYA